jgi:UDP-N-acetylglucosamine--N-acetylmuramyl-(pentapeptide) pyrophosphoryl-undecaprenol N-acetylglucosamine transferase
MHDKNILIMAGGTGGHIYPALAVADKLKENGFQLFWLGSEKGMETSVVPEHGYPLLKVIVYAFYVDDCISPGINDYD